MNKDRVFNYRPMAIGIHGASSGDIENIFKLGILLPHQVGINSPDNCVCYVGLPSGIFIRQAVDTVGEEVASVFFKRALDRNLRVACDYAQSRGYSEDREVLDWECWREQTERLPALVFFKGADQVMPVESMLEGAAKGNYQNGFIFPEMRLREPINPEKVVGAIRLTPQDVEEVEEKLQQPPVTTLRRVCRSLLIERAYIALDEISNRLLAQDLKTNLRNDPDLIY